MNILWFLERSYKMIFYHGTTTNIKVNKVLLPPNETGVLREDFRKNLQDKVFVNICNKAFVKSFEKI